MNVAIVTGGGGGIGRAISLRLAEAGHAIVVAGRNSGPLEQVAAEVRRAGTQAIAVPADVTRHDSVEKLIRAAMEEYGQIDVLVNNAGFAPMIPTPDLTPAQWHEVLDTNLSAAFYAIRSVWPIMREQHQRTLQERRDQQRARAEKSSTPKTATGGAIVNISSVSSRDPFPGLGAYGVAKCALNMLSHVSAQEGEPLGIRVVSIAPGAVETQMFRHMFNAEQVPEDQVLVPNDVADAVADFVGGSLRYASGETIYIHRTV